MAALLDTRLPLVPGRGYSVTLENSPWRVNFPAILVEGRAAITPMDGNKIRFGGTMEITSTNTPPRYARVQGILNAVKRFFPEFDVPMPPKEQIWYGYRPCSADGLPYIGRIKKYNNVVVATGHSMLGLSLGAGTGKPERCARAHLGPGLQALHRLRGVAESETGDRLSGRQQKGRLLQKPEGRREIHGLREVPETGTPLHRNTAGS